MDSFDFTKRYFQTFLLLVICFFLSTTALSQPANKNTKAVGRVTVEDFGKAGAGPFDPAASRGVFIGINEFTSDFGNKPGDLKSCVNDAVDLAAAFCNLGLIEPTGVTLILSGKPGKVDSIQNFEKLVSGGATVSTSANRDYIDYAVSKTTGEVTDEGIYFLTWSSHGFEAGGVQYLAPANMYYTSDKPTGSELRSRALSESVLNDTIKNRKVKRAIVIFDACRESKQMAPGMPELISAAKGMITLYAVTSGKLAIDGNKNGQFTEKVLGALTAEAPPENLKGSTQGYVTVRTLMDYLGTAGRYEDAEILNMPLCRHPGLYLHVERSREVIEYYKQAKVVDMNASRNRRYFTHIGVLDVELALESPAGPELADEIEYYLDTPEKQKNYRNRNSFADAYEDLTSQSESVPAPEVAESAVSTDSTDPLKAKHDAAYNEAKGLDESSYTSVQYKIDAWNSFLDKWSGSPEKDKVLARIEELKQSLVIPTPDGPTHGDIKTVDLGGGVTMDLVYIKPGTFVMGTSASEIDRFVWEDDTDVEDEAPQTTITLTKGFWMGKTEVTQAQWRVVMGTTIQQQRDKADKDWPISGEGDNNPMYYISWEECVDFCKKLSSKSGLEITLPTEAQWEYACRAGTTTRFSFGYSDSQLGDYAWYGGNSGFKTQPVGTKKPNPWSLYDMNGNVWEWCLDWYSDYPGGSVSDYKGASSGSYRVNRGGGRLNSQGDCRSALRGRSAPDSRGRIIGFRVVSPSPPN